MVSDSVVLISAFPSPLRPASAATTILAVAGHVEHVANAHYAFPAVPHRVPVGVADPVHLQEEKVGHWLVNRGLLPQRGLGSRRTRTDAQFSRFFDGVGEITRVHMPMKMASGGPGARGAVKENRGFVCLLYISHGVRIIYFPVFFLLVDLRMWTLRRPRPRRSQLRSPRTHSTVGSSS